jgi:hypothetical protein
MIRLPRGTYYYGPLIIQANIIEPFIITDVFIGISPTEMYKIDFDSMEKRAEFINMLEFYKDDPVENRIDFNIMREIVNKLHREDERQRREGINE